MTELPSLPSRQPGQHLTPDLQGASHPGLLPAPEMISEAQVLPVPQAEGRVTSDSPNFPGEPAVLAAEEASDSHVDTARYVTERRDLKIVGSEVFGRPAVKGAMGGVQSLPPPTGKGYDSVAEALHARAEEFKDLAYKDSLTGLTNRLGLNEWFKENRPSVAGVMMLDIKGFGKFNEVFTHAGADEALKMVAKRLMKQLRTGSKSDELPHPERRNVTARDLVARDTEDSRDTVAGRYGGDEFIAVIDLTEVPETSRQYVMDMLYERVADLGVFSKQIEDDEGKKKEMSMPLKMHRAYRISTDPQEMLEAIYGSIKTAELKSDKNAEQEAGKRTSLRRILSRVLRHAA